VLSGRLLLLQGADATQLAERVITAGSIWRNQPGVIHTIEALEDSDVLEVSTPISTMLCACKTITDAREPASTDRQVRRNASCSSAAFETERLADASDHDAEGGVSDRTPRVDCGQFA
jgi:hypothetical protein